MDEDYWREDIDVDKAIGCIQCMCGLCLVFNCNDIFSHLFLYCCHVVVHVYVLLSDPLLFLLTIAVPVAWIFLGFLGPAVILADECC